MMTEEKGNSGFTLKACIIAILISVFLLATSSYIALKIGALPWPIIFSVIASAAIIKILSKISGKTDIHEINTAAAGGTIGGLVASGVVFTIPGILFLQSQGTAVSMPDPLILSLIVVSAGILGVLLSAATRKIFVEEENLPYPSGSAGAEVLKASDKIGKKTYYIAFALIITGIFALLRDMFFAGGFPVSLNDTIGLSFLIYPMPLAIAIGYILGKKAAVNSWFSGSVIGWIILVPLMAVFYGIDPAGGTGIVKDLGMGLVLGSGIGFFVSYIIPRSKRIFAPMFRWKGRPWYTKLTPLISLIIIVLLTLSGVPLLASLITVLGTWIMVTVASMMTGESDINPLEQFGIIIGLLSIGIFAAISMPFGYLPAFLVVCFVSVATAVAGDIGHDYKAAKIVGTKASDIIKVDLVSVIVAGLLAPGILSVIINAYRSDFFTASMPAPQAQLVAGSIFGFANPHIFYAGFAVAFIWIVAETLSKKKGPVLPMVFGIGMFLGPTLGILLGIGGAIRHMTDKKRKSLFAVGIVIAAGMMGGEGIAGFASGALFISGIPMINSLQIITGIFLIMLAAFILFIKKRGMK